MYMYICESRKNEHIGAIQNTSVAAAGNVRVTGGNTSVINQNIGKPKNAVPIGARVFQQQKHIVPPLFRSMILYIISSSRISVNKKRNQILQAEQALSTR